MTKHLLALAMADRRHELGETVASIAGRAGVSRSTWTELELGRREALRAPTGTKIDEVLGWVPGTAAGAFAAEDDPSYSFVMLPGAVIADRTAPEAVMTTIDYIALLLEDLDVVQLTLVRDLVERLSRLAALEEVLDKVSERHGIRTARLAE